MAWSTRQVAELAGTTVKAVRHYHRIGLLEEPERASNGYKRYGISHLTRLLRIRRLVDLGVPLAEIAVVEGPDDRAEQALRALDAELAASIERQQRMRAELAAVLRNRTLAELPPGFDGIREEVPRSGRSLMLLYARVFSPEVMDALQEIVSRPMLPVETEFEGLPADADEATRADLAQRYLPEFHRQYEAYPAMRDAWRTAPGGEAYAASVVVPAMVEYYNWAQLDVLQRMNALLAEE